MQQTFTYPEFAYRPSPEQASGKPQRHPVVVVGAGPVGLTAALDLAARGLQVVVLDDKSKAAFQQALGPAYKQYESRYSKALIESAQAEWVYQTHITRDTEALTARAEAAFTGVQVNNALGAARHAATPGLSYDTKRKLDRMRTLSVLPAPTTPGAAEELAGLRARMQGVYGQGQGTLRGQPINGSDIEAAMGTNRNPDELREMWRAKAFDVLWCHNHSRLGRSFTLQSWVIENVIRSGAKLYRHIGGWIRHDDYGGQIQNRLSFAISLAQSQVVNTKAAESRIRDANIAEESANLTRFSILNQSGIAALAQANQQTGAVLSLLR